MPCLNHEPAAENDLSVQARPRRPAPWIPELAQRLEAFSVARRGCRLRLSEICPFVDPITCLNPVLRLARYQCALLYRGRRIKIHRRSSSLTATNPQSRGLAPAPSRPRPGHVLDGAAGLAGVHEYLEHVAG